MKSPLRLFIFLVVSLICGSLGWWLAYDLQKANQPPHVSSSSSPKREERPRLTRPARPFSTHSTQDQFQDGTTVEVFASCRPNELILRFPTDDTYGAFLSVLGSSEVRLLGQLDRLRAMRVGFEDVEELDLLLLGENISVYSGLPSIPDPTPPTGIVQTNLLGFGDQVLPWLGVRTSNARWGVGVKIAVIDSGIVAHPGLPSFTQSVDITAAPTDPSQTYPHGTAVASLISGTNPTAPGIAPAAQLISIRVIDESRATDAFAVAAGLLAAMDEGAQLINISLGTTEDNPLTRDAVALVQQQGIVIIASAGNSAQDRAAYPADYPGVISVGAIDARGTQLEFSNYGDTLGLTAPGFSINAAIPGGQYTRISGTSASAPLVTGAIAAVMSDGSGTMISAQKAAEIVMAYTDEAGIPGPDSQYGVGILNLGRAMNRNRPGIVDAAITQQQIVTAADDRSREIQVTLQNRGTTVLVNLLLQVATPAGARQINITTLAPCAIQTVSLSLDPSVFLGNSPISVTSALDLGSNNGIDSTPQNNQRTDSLWP